MKLINITSIAGLMIISTQTFSGVIENSQIMPPPGPYQSIMNNTPPAFVPYGSNQPAINPHQQNQMPQTFNHFPADTRSMIRPAMQTPEWVVNEQKAVQKNIEKMLKENAERNKENEKRYTEYLKKSEAMSAQRQKDNKQWLEDNNKQMKQAWQNMLDQYAKQQKQQISQAQNMPDWMKKRMLQQHEQQLAMMNANPPVAMNNMQRPMHAAPQYQQNARPPMGQPMFNPNRSDARRFTAPPAGQQNFMRPPVQQIYPQRPMMNPNNRMQMMPPGMPSAAPNAMPQSMPQRTQQGMPQRMHQGMPNGQPFNRQTYRGQPMNGPAPYPQPYNNYR